MSVVVLLSENLYSLEFILVSMELVALLDFCLSLGVVLGQMVLYVV